MILEGFLKNYKIPILLDSTLIFAVIPTVSVGIGTKSFNLNIDSISLRIWFKENPSRAIECLTPLQRS